MLDLEPVRNILNAWRNDPYNLLQMLIRVQEVYGYIPAQAIDALSHALGLTPAHIQGVIGFYSFLYTSPRDYTVLFSDNIIERLQGKQALMDTLLQRLGVKPGKTRADGRVCVDNTACIGMSDQGPAALVNGHTVTRLTPARIAAMADLIEARQPLSEWPAEWFEVEDNIAHPGRLLGTPFTPGAALRTGLGRSAEAILAALAPAGIRGCGGAGFFLDKKWDFCRKAPADQRFVVCNADEGEPGTFKDRVLLQSHADLVFEGMTLCAQVIGARQGFLYLRGEYRYLLDPLEHVLARRRRDKLLGKNILGQAGFDFDIEIHLGAGSYVCGAEVALIASLEGNRGVPRKRPPPFPVTRGYRDQPTVVNNVETLAHAALAMLIGSEQFASIGTSQSRGSKLLSVSGDCERPGIYEFPFGVTVREVLDACGAQNVQAVQNSGPAGMCVAPAEFDRQLCFEDINSTGSFMVFNKQRDLLEMVDNFAGFFVHESCGFCTPCRVGTSLIKQLVEKIRAGRGTGSDLKEMASLSSLIKNASHCGLGLTATNHISDTLKKFPDIYESRLKESSFAPFFDLDAALADARQIARRDDTGAHWGN
jgi:[NiFe] hydrogenase diaphorase moiety large subunit